MMRRPPLTQSTHRDLLLPVRETLVSHGFAVTELVDLTGGLGGTNLRARTPDGPLVVKVRPTRRPLLVTRTVASVLAYRGIPHPEVLLPPTRTGAGWLLALRWVDGT